MIVILHGIPGDDNRITLHEIREFQETIIVEVFPIIGVEVGRIINPHRPLRAVAHELTYEFKYHDGKSYHYQFVSSS